jgi:hypothetical protein
MIEEKTERTSYSSANAGSLLLLMTGVNGLGRIQLEEKNKKEGLIAGIALVIAILLSVLVIYFFG